MSYTNSDGLYVLMYGDKGVPVNAGATSGQQTQALVIDVDLRTLGTSFAAANINPQAPYIPAGSVITRAVLVMTTAATSGGAATLTIGTYNAAGTAIDADGIDATIALTAIDAIGEVVRCDGAQTTTAGYLTENAYIGSIYATAAYTAGAGKLYVEYVKLV